MKLRPLAAVVLIALLLYWVVQDPVGAASVVKQLFDWTVHMLQLIANRVVQFLNALV